MPYCDLSLPQNIRAISAFYIFYNYSWKGLSKETTEFLEVLGEQLPFFSFTAFKSILLLFLNNRGVFYRFTKQGLKNFMDMIYLNCESVVEELEVSHLTILLRVMVNLSDKFYMLFDDRDRLVEHLVLIVLNRQKEGGNPKFKF